MSETMIDLDSMDFMGCTRREALARFAETNPQRRFWLSPKDWDCLYRETSGMTGVKSAEYETGRVAVVFPANGELLTAMHDATLGERQVRAR